MPSPHSSPDPVARVAREWEGARTRVAAYVGSLVHNRSDRDDVLQQTALYLIEHAADYRETGFPAWAMRVAKLRVLELWRRNKYDRRMQALTDVADAVEEAFIDTAPPDEARVVALRACLDKLPLKHRRLIDQRYRDGTALSELSIQWQRTPATLTVALHRIRAALAQCIEGRLPLEETL